MSVILFRYFLCFFTILYKIHKVMLKKQQDVRINIQFLSGNDWILNLHFSTIMLLQNKAQTGILTVCRSCAVEKGREEWDF